mmetsp:Transcript_12619/g.41379  ORF Transcript_12619/g.41379 Transcript_12619/m.41379 type:complete len:120 (-) Transcript_12619:1138-1497(-)
MCSKERKKLFSACPPAMTSPLPTPSRERGNSNLTALRRTVPHLLPPSGRKERKKVRKKEEAHRTDPSQTTRAHHRAPPSVGRQYDVLLVLSQPAEKRKKNSLAFIHRSYYSYYYNTVIS